MTNITTRLFSFLSPQILSAVLQFHSSSSFVFTRHFPGLGRIANIEASITQALNIEDRPLAGERGVIQLCSPEEDIDTRPPSALSFSNDGVDGRTTLELIRRSFSSINGRRNYPSAGGLYPVETFIAFLAPKIDIGIVTGIYHYLPNSMKLELLRESDPTEVTRALFHYPGELELIPDFVIFFQLNLTVALCKYRLRGYRFGLLEAGSMYQHAERVGRELGVGSRVWGGFADGEVSRICGTNPTVYVPVIAQLFGIRAADL